MKTLPLTLSLTASLLLAACSPVLNNLPGVYSLEIQQGNIVDQAMVDQLKPGMNKRQVLYVMGSPMLIDAFHPKRWDYVYSDQISGKDRVQKRMTLIFENELLIGIQGDLKPNAVSITSAQNETTVDVPKRSLDRTMLEKVSSLFSYGSDSKESSNLKSKPRDDDAPH